MIPRSVASTAAALPTITQLVFATSSHLQYTHTSSINDYMLHTATADRSLEERVDLTQCYKDINTVSTGDILTKDTYFKFADIMSNQWFSDNEIFSYSVLPYDLKFAFVTLSCECHTMGGKEDCCENGHAHLNVEGADGQDVSRAQAKYLNDICQLTFSTIGADRINRRSGDVPTTDQPDLLSTATPQPLPTPPTTTAEEGEDESAIVPLMPTQPSESTSQTLPNELSTSTATEEDESVIVPLMPTQSSESTSQTSPFIPSTATAPEEDKSAVVPLMPTQSSVSTLQPSPTPPPATEEEEDEPAIFPRMPTPLPNTPNDKISPAGITSMTFGVAALLSLLALLLCGRKEEKQTVKEENVDDIEANDKMMVDVDADRGKDAPDSDGSPDGTKSMTNSIFSGQSTFATTAAVSSANTKRSKVEDLEEEDARSYEIPGILSSLSSFSQEIYEDDCATALPPVRRTDLVDDALDYAIEHGNWEQVAASAAALVEMEMG